MNTYTVRRVVAACAVAGSMLIVPAESQAIFHWFGCGGCGGGTTAYRPYTAAYAPYYAGYAPAPACSPCNTCSPCGQTCNYVPQTCYRTVYQQVPVTACQPVVACDPCGNQVTTMRPIVTYQTQARLVPYTTYRPVYAPAPCATGGCATGGCASGTCGTGVSYASPVSTSGCSTCSTPTYSTPISSPTYTTPSPSYSSAPAATLGAPGSTVPSLGPAPSQPSSESTNPRTYRDDSGVTDPESRLRPIPDTQNQNIEPSNKKTNSTLTPRLLGPDDRTTYRPLKRTATVIPVSSEEIEENDGWRAARR